MTVLRKADYESIGREVLQSLQARFADTATVTVVADRYYITSDMNTHMALRFEEPTLGVSLTLRVAGNIVRSLFSVRPTYLPPGKAEDLGRVLQRLEVARQWATKRFKRRLREVREADAVAAVRKRR